MMNVIKIKPILPGEVLQILDKYKNERDLTYIETKVYSYLQHIKKLSLEDQKKLYEELKQINIPDELRIKIVEILPKNEDELKAVLYTYTLSKEDMKRIINIVSKYI